MHEYHSGNGHASREGIAHLSHSLEQALDRNRTWLEEMARFTRDETLRLAHMQLDQAGQAFAHLHEKHDFGDMVSAQQEWAKQTMQEYASLGLHYAEMFRTLTQHVQTHVESAAGEFRHRTGEEAEESGLKDMARTAANRHDGRAPLPAE